MSNKIALRPEERLIWAGRRGQPARLPGGAAGVRMAYAWFLLMGFGGFTLIPLLLFPGTRLMALAGIVLVVGAIFLIRAYRRRPAIFLTDRRLVERTITGGLAGVELGDLASYRRRINTYVYRGSTSDQATNTILLASRQGGSVSLGPVLDYDELTGALDGVIGGDIDPTLMRALDGAPAAVEAREDVFVAVENRTGEEVYGPLFIGPRGLVRFTSKLPLAVEGMLLTALGRPGSVEELESRVVSIARRPNAGHSLVAERASVSLTMEGNTLLADLKTRVERIDLSETDAARARRYLETGPRG